MKQLVLLFLLSWTSTLPSQSLASRLYLDVSGLAFLIPVANAYPFQTHIQAGIGYRIHPQHGLGIGAFRWAFRDAYMGNIFSGLTAQYRYQNKRWLFKGELGLMGRVHGYMTETNRYSRAELGRPFSALICRGKVGVRFCNNFVVGMALSYIPRARLDETLWEYESSIPTPGYVPTYTSIRLSRIGLQPFFGLALTKRDPKSFR